jgi:hypothetical protein
VNPSSLVYVLNPTGDLIRTQADFKPRLIGYFTCSIRSHTPETCIGLGKLASHLKRTTCFSIFRNGRFTRKPSLRCLTHQGTLATEPVSSISRDPTFAC